MYVKNAWYVAAWSTEVSRELLSREICDVSVLLFRRENGDAVAIGNRCPHRFAPLQMGKLMGDVVQCPYHGLKFDHRGACVENPHGDGKVPRACKVPSFPAVERHGLIWLWFGDQEIAEESLIPDFSCLVDTENYRTVGGTILMDANYELITDNLVDLSHVEFVHEGILGSEAIKRGRHEVLQDGLTVHSNRWCPDGLAPPAWDAMFGNYGKPVDHWLNMRWDPPAHMLLDVGVTPTGRPVEDGIMILGTDILTPASKTRTHYFWAISRPYDLDNPEVDKAWEQAIDAAFVGQDKPMLEAVQVMMGDKSFDELKPVMISPDAGAVRCRRIIADLISGECSVAVDHANCGEKDAPANRASH
ncbi:MAG: aromatic ring-hydroxylating dioxygenase subunit alpha [Sphingomonadales bacterium]|nr:aromatic ring-hydroxylating dioxygenase subunit alpha [Sphingomonadales bacterium]